MHFNFNEITHRNWQFFVVVSFYYYEHVYIAWRMPNASDQIEADIIDCMLGYAFVCNTFTIWESCKILA